MRFMKKLYHAWLRFAQILGRINTAILLTIVYIVVVGPFALTIKILRKDLLQKKLKTSLPSYWQERSSTESTLEHYHHQF